MGDLGCLGCLLGIGGFSFGAFSRVLGCFFGFLVGYLCILSCVLRGALRFFDIYNITYQKRMIS